MAGPDLTFQEVIAIELAEALPSTESGSSPKDGQSLPYVQFGPVEIEDSYPAARGLLCDIHVWSKVEGPHEVKNIQHSIRQALHAQIFERGGYRFTTIREYLARSRFDPAEGTWHGIQRFRAIASTAE